MNIISMASREKLIALINYLNQNTRFLQNKNFIQHGDTSIYDHVISVAIKSIEIAEKYNLNVDYDSLIRGALLHDYFLYDWHKPHKYKFIHGFTHPRCAYNNAKSELDLNEIEKDIIIKHMFPLTIIPPKYLEGWIVTAADKIVTIRESIKPRAKSLLSLETDI